jgi:hypothetical protein
VADAVPPYEAKVFGMSAVTVGSLSSTMNECDRPSPDMMAFAGVHDVVSPRG